MSFRTFAKPNVAIATAVLLTLALVPQLASYLDNPFLLRVGLRIMILAVAACSLNIILGYGGMVSLGHAAFIGIAAYVVAILNWHVSNAEPIITWPFAIQGSANTLVVFPLAILTSAFGALVIGAISLRTTGLHFIMITLAFAQMLYFLFISFQKYGGEDGTQLLTPLEFGPTLINRSLLYYVVFFALLAVLFFIDRLVRSRFGLVLQGCRQNERRLAAVGYSTFRYKLTAFVVAGSIAGIAGVLLAASQQYVSPSDLAWSRSGDLVIMLVLGGVGTLFGPILGATFYVGLELLLGTWTTHWQLIFGPIFILFVLLTKGGIVGLLDGPWWSKTRG